MRQGRSTNAEGCTKAVGKNAEACAGELRCAPGHKAFGGIVINTKFDLPNISSVHNRPMPVASVQHKKKLFFKALIRDIFFSSSFF